MSKFPTDDQRREAAAQNGHPLQGVETPADMPSPVQIIPNLGRAAKELFVFQRTPSADPDPAAAEALQAVGVEAVPVQDFGDQHTDPQLAHRGHFVPLTVSIGGTAMSGANVSAQRLIDIADAALLQAKRAGRNRTVVLPASGETLSA